MNLRRVSSSSRGSRSRLRVPSPTPSPSVRSAIRSDLGLPNLQYGYVMFNANPRRVPVYTYARADGGERHDLADLDPRPAFGYKRARVRARRRRVLRDPICVTCATAR